MGFNLADAIKKKKAEEEEKEKVSGFEEFRNKKNEIWENTPNKGFTPSKPVTGSSAPFANIEEDKDEDEGFSLSKALDRYKAGEVAEGLNERLNSYFNNFNSFAQGYSDKVSGFTGEYSDSYVSDASDWMSGLATKGNELQTEAYDIVSILDTYSDYYNPDFVKSAKKAIFDSLGIKNDIGEGATTFADYWKQWKDEGSYKEWQEAMKEDQKLLNTPLSGVKLGIQQLEKDQYDLRVIASDFEVALSNSKTKDGDYQLETEFLSKLRSYAQKYGYDLKGIINGTSGDALMDAYYRLNDLYKKDLSDRQSFYRRADTRQTQERLKTTAVNASDFEEYAQKGEALGVDPKGFKKAENMIAYLRNNPSALESYYESAESAGNNGSGIFGEAFVTNRLLDQIEYKAAAHMTDEEFKIYNYYFATDKGKADQYLESIEETLNKRQAGAEIDEVGDSKLLSLVLKAESGLENWASGLEGFGNMITGKDTYIPPTSTQIAASSEQIKENLPGGWGVAGDLIQTTTNQLPSIMMSFVPVIGQGLSLASMGISASGNAYNEMIGLGYTKEQARGYGLLVGGSEVLLGSLLDGTTKLGGTLVQKLTGKSLSSFLGGLDNAFARVAVNTGTRMLSEFTEESLQTVLEPWFKSVVTNTDFEAPDLDEILYSGLLGALSAGMLGNIDVTNDSTVTGAIGTAIKGAQVKKLDGGVSRLAKLGSTFSADTVAYKIANKVNDDTGAYTIGRLLNGVNATLTTQNTSEIVKSLERKGIATEHANSIASALEAVVEGAELNPIQRMALEANPIIARTIRDVIINPNSTVNQRTKGLYDLANDMSKGKSASVATDTANAVADGAKTLEASESATTEENAIQGKYEVADDGKLKRISTGEDVAISGVESVENGEVTLRLENGEVVDATDVAFSNYDESLLYEMVTRMGDITPQTATALIKNFKATDGVSAQTYALDIPLAYQYGKINYAKGLENLDLTIDQRQVAFHHGRNAAEAEVKAKQTAITEKGTIKGTGSVRFEKGATAKSKAQKKAVKLAGLLAKAMGIDIVFYDATIEGTYGSDANGYFDERTNTIHLDLQNSTDDAKTIVFTMAHELTHFIKKWSPTKFKVFADFLMEQYGDTTVTLESKMEETGLSEEDAYEELICDACETMLLDSNAVVKLMQLRATDLDLFEKIKLHVLELLNKIRAEYKKLGLEPTSDEAKALLKMEGVLEKLSAMFEEAAVDAVQNYQAVESLETDSVSVSEDGTIRMQMKQYQQTGRATLLRYLVEQYGNKTADDLISTIDNIYDVLSEVKQNEALSVFSNWQDTEVELDENGHPIFTTSVNNGDYDLNQDFSRVCKKRRQLDFVLNMLAEDPAFEASNLTKQDFVKINKAIKKHGFEIACALCFVDSKRFRQAEWADSFANTWNDILNAVVKDSSKLTPFNFATKNPNIADDGIEIDTSKSVMYRKWSDGKEDVKNRRAYESLDQMLSKDSDGKWLEGNTNVRTIATLIRDNPELRHTFRGADIIGSQGFDTIQRLAPKIRSILDGWGGSSVPKPSSNDASYDSSIINMSKYNKETAYAMGGVRMNSFSDFMAHMFFDYCQAFADLSAKELPSQAYTKELDYVRLFGRSGQKQNMSGIAAIRDNALPTTASKNVTKAEAEANEKIEKMIAGLDVSRLLEHLNKDIYQLTESDVEQFLDMCDYVWADESINMKHATLLQTGILYDKLSESKIEECYELLKAGEVEQALKVAGEENVDREYAKHCGTIVVGVSDAHIRKLLRDPTIRMVIPYHKSGLNPVIARELRIAAYNDYTLAQTTGVKRKGTKTSEKIGSDAIKDAYGLKDFAFYDWFGKTIDGKLYDGKATADKYLEWCENGYYDETVGDYVYYTNKKAGYILASEFHKKASIVPKFDTFASEENYYKLLEDFDCYDTITGEHSAQGAVDFLRNGLPSDYKDVLVRALTEEQKVSDDFRDHLDNKGLKDEVMEIVKARGYTPSEGIKKQAKKTTIDLTDDTDLSKLVEGVHGSKRYKAIAEYIINVLGNEEITLSDGTAAIVDKRDATHIASNAGSSKTSQIAKIKDLVTQAELYAYDNDVEHNKFDQFLYYQAMVRYANEEFPLYLNVGRGLNDKKYHIYDITKKIRDTANRINGFWRPKPNEGYAIENDISNKSIPQPKPIVKRQIKKTSSNYAPVFYSQMGREIDAIKMDKVGATSIVPYLKGKGIKHDEIKWSGIEAFLEGKKSVTKAELQEFLAGSQLEIVEQVSGEDIDLRYNGSERAYTLYDDNGNAIDTFTYNEFMGGYVAESDEEIYSNELELKESLRDVYGKNSSPKWADYRLDGGENYREIVFQLPDATYSNRAMKVHWGQDAEGVLVHARIQDMTTSDGKKMLFIEEIQSDYHNEGAKSGYVDNNEIANIEKLEAEANELFFRVEDYSMEMTGSAGEWDTIEKTDKGAKLLRDYREASAKHKKAADGLAYKIPDAPFRDNYHEYVLKRLLRMAAEEGYDSIGWTPAYIQSERWSDEFAEGYRIEYDQDIPKFLRKYGKKWGASVSHTTLNNESNRSTYIDNNGKQHNSIREWYDSVMDSYFGKDNYIWSEYISGRTRVTQTGNVMNIQLTQTKKILDETLNIVTEPDTVWSMDITESMEQSVLYEGQPKFQKKKLSNRTILANTLENAIDTTTQEGQNELRWLKDYQGKIALIEKEEAHLAEVKAEIAEISFNKGTDRTKLNGLNDEKIRTANRINTYDKQLTRLEAMKPIKDVLEREKEMVRKRTEQKGKERLKAYKEKTAETQRELLTRWQESRKNAVEGRHKTEMRHKIKGVVADLNKLLLDPTKDKHVPIGLQRPVAAALDIINMDTVGADERVAKYNELIAKSKDPVEIERLTKTRDRIQMQGENLADKLTALKNAYAEFKESDDPLIRNAHNEAIENLISETVKTAGNTAIRDMSLNQLEAVYDMYKAILATVRNANKMFKADRQATVSEHSEAVKVEVREVGGHNDKVRKSTKGIKSFVWELLKPIAAFKHIGSKTLSKLFDNVRAGEDTYARDLSEAKKFFTEQSAKYHYDSWDFKKRHTFKDATGQEFSLSLDQIMSLYAYSKRSQADRHLEVGGFVFDDAIEVIEKNKLGIPVKYEVNDANPYRLNNIALGEITSSLTSEQKAFIDQMQTYLSDVMGAKGNEISLAMYDIKLYKEKHYFPLKTSRYFREFNPEQSGNPMLRNAGFSKKTVPQAGNPIVLSNFMDVWGGHVNDMSMYHSFVLPLEDFMRVYNYSSTAGGYDSVQQYIKNAYGSQANHYVEKLMQDINGGVVSGTLPNGWLKMFGKFKKATVAASMSTIVQQPTAVLRAMGKINPIHFVGTPFKGGHKKTWEKIKQYAPVAIIKEMGGIDVGSGRKATDFITAENYKGLGKIKGFFTDSDYRDSIFMWGATKADELGWNAIWKAVEREVASEKKFKPGTEEFYKAVGERFTDIITETQVYDSVFSRSGIMRDKGDLNKFATSFMGEPITSLNMIYSAILDAKRGGSKLNAAREIGSVYASIVAASALASVIYALRDDDEDEAYLEKWAEAFGNKLSSEVWIHNMIPYVRDLASIIEGWDVERPDMSIFTDIKSSFDKLYKINEDGEFEWRVDFSDPASVYSAVENFGGSIASAFGLPVKNIMRETRSIFNAFKAMTDDIRPEDVKGAFGRGWSGEEKDKNEKLYEAIVSGDEGRLSVYRNTYKTEEAYETAVRSALREHDPRIVEAAQARINGDIAEYTRIAKAIIAEGNFKQDIVVGAINAEINAINKAANDEVKPSDDEVEKEEVTSIYRADDINSALANGDMTLAKEIIDELIEVKVANGTEESNAKSSVKGSITRYWKPLVQEALERNDTKELLRIRDMLFDTGLYGKSRSEVYNTMKKWREED